jgi:UDP-N-acetylenolpyruvoylglucosamine reductase
MKAAPEHTAEGKQARALRTAKNCRHYAMCKIDFLGTGVCASGLEKRFVSYYPEGRMDLYAALREGKIPVTRQALEIADGCTLCGKCDKQCYFVTGLRPVRVMVALKGLLHRHLASGGAVEADPEDRILRRIREIVGEQWATNDRAVAVTYSHDPCPTAEPKMPAYVVLPGSTEEVSALIRLLNQEGVTWAARGNGSNILGFELSEGAVIDLNRMQELAFNERDWSVRIGPGVSAFELQRAAYARGYRVHVAEPAALVCASIMCSGILSLFATAYGTSASNVIDARFVGRDGSLFSLNQKDGPNLFAFSCTDQQSPGICVSADLKLHPMSADEAGVLVPFDTLEKALHFARDCAQRRIGFSIGILGTEYVSSFMAPTQQLADQVKEILGATLGMACLVLVLGDQYALQSVRQMGHPLIDQRLFRALSLGLPKLGQAGWLDLLAELSQDEPFSYLRSEGFAELAETALAPSPELLAGAVDPDLSPFHEELYSRPELTDLVWLNMFRITSSRVGREKHFFPILIYLPLECGLIDELCHEFRQIARRHGIKNELGFITPIDSGKRCIFEYDYYVDQCDPEEISRVRAAVAEAGALLEKVSARTGTIRWMRYVLYQGFCRMENLLYAGG